MRSNRVESIEAERARIQDRLDRAIKHGSCGASCEEPARVARLTKILASARLNPLVAQ